MTNVLIYFRENNKIVFLKRNGIFLLFHKCYANKCQSIICHKHKALCLPFHFLSSYDKV